MDRAIDRANREAKKPESFGYGKSREHEVNLNPQFGPYKYSKKEKDYIKSKGGLKSAKKKALEKVREDKGRLVNGERVFSNGRQPIRGGKRNISSL